MLVVEQIISGHSHWHDFSHKQTRSPLHTDSAPESPVPLNRSNSSSSVRENGSKQKVAANDLQQNDADRFDLSMAQMEEAEGSEDMNEDGTTRPLMRRSENSQKKAEAEKKARALPTTIGLVIHSLADGLALGAAASSSSDDNGTRHGLQLSLVVFLALIIHKGE